MTPLSAMMAWRTPRRAGEFIGICFLRCGDSRYGPSLESRESSAKSARACSAGGRTVSPGKSHAQKNSMLKVTLQISRVRYQLGISEHLLPLSMLPHNPHFKVKPGFHQLDDIPTWQSPQTLPVFWFSVRSLIMTSCRVCCFVDLPDIPI